MAYHRWALAVVNALDKKVLCIAVFFEVSRHIFPPPYFPAKRLPAILGLKGGEPAAGGLLAADFLAPAEVMRKRLYSQVSALWGAVQQRSILLPAIFVFLWQASLPKLVSHLDSHASSFPSSLSSDGRQACQNLLLVWFICMLLPAIF